MGGQGAKIKPSTLQMGKASRPLKVPRNNAYVNAHGSLYAGGSSGPNGGSKPVTEKKGPHIQYQIKTGKPNSQSSNEVNSSVDFEGSDVY